MTTYITVEGGSQLLRRARQEMDGKRLGQQEQAEITAAAQAAMRSAPIIPDELLTTSRREVAAAIPSPLLITAPTTITVLGEYTGQTLILNINMETEQVKERLRGENSTVVRQATIYSDAQSLAGTGASVGFGFTYADLGLKQRSTFFPSGEPGQFYNPADESIPPYAIPYVFDWLEPISVGSVTVTLVDRGVVPVLPPGGALGDYCLVYTPESSSGYWIFDPGYLLLPGYPQRVSGWANYINQPPATLSYTLDSVTDLLGAQFYGSVEWSLRVLLLYEVVSNTASPRKYISPIPAVVAQLKTDSRSLQVDVVYPFSNAAGYRDIGVSNGFTYVNAVLGRSNAGVQWAIDSYFTNTNPTPPSNIYPIELSPSMPNVETWGNTPFNPSYPPEPETQPPPKTWIYTATIRDPRP